MGHRYDTRTCMNCNQPFEARLWDIDHGQGGFFCSQSCRATFSNNKRYSGQAAPKPHTSQDGKPTRKDIARSFLDKHGYVTNRMFDSVHLLHTGRNAVAEVKGEYAEKGYAIKFIPAPKFLDNKWVLEPIQATVGGL